MAAPAQLDVSIHEDLLHGAAWERYGTFCRDETLAAARAADAVIVGAVGGPKWDDINVPGGPEMQDGLMRLRKGLDAYLGLRPAKAVTCLQSLTPFRPGLLRGADVMVLREMCGGAFFGQPRGIETETDNRRRGFDTTVYDPRNRAWRRGCTRSQSQQKYRKRTPHHCVIIASAEPVGAGDTAVDTNAPHP